MTTNSSLLRKADIAIADLTANGGELTPEQGASFIRKLIKQPTLIRKCRVVEMMASKRKINKIGFGTRILRKATASVALTANQRSKPTTEQIELDTKEQIAEVRLPYNVLEDNIERASILHKEHPREKVACDKCHAAILTAATLEEVRGARSQAQEGCQRCHVVPRVPK